VALGASFTIYTLNPFFSKGSLTLSLFYLLKLFWDYYPFIGRWPRELKGWRWWINSLRLLLIRWMGYKVRKDCVPKFLVGWLFPFWGLGTRLGTSGLLPKGLKRRGPLKKGV